MEEELCEVCGRRKARYEAEIAGAVLHVCERCAKSGKIIRKLDESQHVPVYPTPTHQHASLKEDEPEEELVEDYDVRIRNALKKLRITYHVLAERLNEKESFIERIVTGKAVPNESLGRRIEKELNIKLYEREEYVPVGHKKKKEEITLGDIIEVKRKNRK